MTTSIQSTQSATRSVSSPPSSAEPDAGRRRTRLPWRSRASLAGQRGVGWASAPFWLPLITTLMRFGMRWQIVGIGEARRRYRDIQNGGGPVIVCANHLTLVDSAIIAWALGSPWWYLWRFSALPWNVPERRNFARSWVQRILVYVMKCVPITRGGDRKEVAAVLERLVYLLARGETVLVFPEGGRSRSGRIDVEQQTYGVGRIATELPGTKVVCVYLRGESQTTWSDLPARGERFHVHIDTVEPKSQHPGLRGSIDVARQILTRLAELERSYFHGRK